MYKIKTLGANGNILCQLPRINKGFLDLGHELVEQFPDFIYCNDFGYHRESIEYKKKYPKSKLILNVLDIPWHCREINKIIDDLTINLMQADGVTTISETVKTQMLSVFPFLQKNGVSVIYQPIKPVKPLKRQRTTNLMMAGRLEDANKRPNLALQGVAVYGGHLDLYGPNDITNLIHPNYKSFITYKGLVSDKELCEAYNTHAAVLITSKNEGLALQIPESLSAKTPIICCSDMTTSLELVPKEFICEPNPFAIADKIKYVTSGDERISKILDEYSERYLKQFSPQSVAQRIIDTYEKIK